MLGSIGSVRSLIRRSSTPAHTVAITLWLSTLVWGTVRFHPTRRYIVYTIIPQSQELARSFRADFRSFVRDSGYAPVSGYRPVAGSILYHMPFSNARGVLHFSTPKFLHLVLSTLYTHLERKMLHPIHLFLHASLLRSTGDGLNRTSIPTSVTNTFSTNRMTNSSEYPTCPAGKTNRVLS